MKTLGLTPVDRAALPDGCERLLVLSRSGDEQHVVHKPGAGQQACAPEIRYQ